jgi:glycosyltransferase involved in cell wall biosynthesis
MTSTTNLSVLFLVNSFDEGGTERQALHLARLLSERGGVRVHMATLNAGGALARLVAQLDVGAVPEYALRSFVDLQMARQLARCAAFIRQHRVQIVHTHGFYSNVFGMLAATLARAPIRIASKREGIENRTASQGRAERIAFRLAHAVVTNCHAVRAQLIAAGVRPRRILTIHNGIDPGRITPRTHDRAEALSMLGLAPTPELRYVTLVANLRLAAKDHGTFLRSAQRVRREIADTRFLIAGDGSLLSEVRSFARRLGLERDVIFLGSCPYIAELLFISDVCVLSSVSEGFPNAVLEYMSAGRPVIATRVGGIPEAIDDGETGLLVTPRDDVLMASGIVALLRNPDRARQIGSSAQAVVLERFSAARQLEGTLALYEKELRRIRHPFRLAPDRAAASPSE